MFQASNANGSCAITRPMCTAVATTYATNRTHSARTTPSGTTVAADLRKRMALIERAVSAIARGSSHEPAGYKRSRRVRGLGPRNALPGANQGASHERYRLVHRACDVGRCG